ncbi:hypothetical protein FHS17_001171 [Paenibacillus lupini]|nr:hypothetical protein [Paenibacillus lupini]
MSVERPPVYICAIGNILDCHRGKSLFPHQFRERLLQQLLRPPPSGFEISGLTCPKHYSYPQVLFSCKTRKGSVIVKTK